MWIRTYSKVYSGLNKQDVWNILIDINNWAQWHDDLDYCKINGEFKAGNYFMLKPKGSSKLVKIVLTEINELKSFTDCTTFFGAKMYNTHAIEETTEGLLLSNKLVLTGPLKWLWIKLVAQHIANTFPHEMDALVNLAKKIHG